MSTEADTKSHYSVSGWLFDLSSFCWQTLSPWENIALGEGHAHWLSLPRVHGGPGRCEAFGGGWDNTSRLGCAKLLDCNPHLLAIGIRPVYGFLGASPRTRPFSTLCARPRCSRLRIYPLVFPPTEALPGKTQPTKRNSSSSRWPILVDQRAKSTPNCVPFTNALVSPSFFSMSSLSSPPSVVNFKFVLKPRHKLHTLLKQSHSRNCSCSPNTHLSFKFTPPPPPSSCAWSILR